MRVLLVGVASSSPALETTLPEYLDGATLSWVDDTAELSVRLADGHIDCLVVTASASPGVVGDLRSTVADRAFTIDCPVVVLTTDTDRATAAWAEVPSVTDVRNQPSTAAGCRLLAQRIQHAVSGHGPPSPALDQLIVGHTLPILLIDAETGGIVDANDAAVTFYGYSLAELTSRSVDDINTLDPGTVAERRQQAVETDGERFVFEHALRSGAVRTVGVSTSPVSVGDRTFLLSIINDITDRVETENELRAVTDRYQRLAEQNIVGIYVIEDREFTYVNPMLAAYFGTTPAVMVGTDVLDWIHPDDHETVRQRLQEREDGVTEAVHYTLRGVTVDGETVVVEAHGGRIQTSSGVEIIGTLLDVSERDTSERERRRLSRALEHAASAVYITDAEGVIEFVNPAFEEITGYSADEAVGATPRLLKSGRAPPDYYRRLYRTLHAGDVWEERIINRRKGGELYYAYQTIAPYTDADGETEGYVAIQSDVTADRIERQVIQVYHRIFRHNLRNKLNVILGNVDLLERAVDDPTTVEYLGDVRAAATALLGLSEKVTIVSDTIGEPNRALSTNLTELLVRQRDLLEVEYPSATITLDAPELVMVPGASLVEVAVHELLENAVVHNDTTEPQVDVTVSVNESESVVELVISDTGPGLSNLERMAIARGVETPLQHATGLGLWLVSWVVTRLGGEFEFVESDADTRGQTVTVRFPLGAESADDTV